MLRESRYLDYDDYKDRKGEREKNNRMFNNKFCLRYQLSLTYLSKRKLRDLILNQIYLDENEETVRKRETYIIKDYDSYNNKCIEIYLIDTTHGG